jgi:hypothetical protein
MDRRRFGTLLAAAALLVAGAGTIAFAQNAKELSASGDSLKAPAPSSSSSAHSFASSGAPHTVTHAASDKAFAEAPAGSSLRRNCLAAGPELPARAARLSSAPAGETEGVAPRAAKLSSSGC